MTLGNILAGVLKKCFISHVSYFYSVECGKLSLVTSFNSVLVAYKVCLAIGRCFPTSVECETEENVYLFLAPFAMCLFSESGSEMKIK